MRHAWLLLALLAGLQWPSAARAGAPILVPRITYWPAPFHHPYHGLYFGGPVYRGFYGPPPVTTVIIPLRIPALPPAMVEPEPPPQPNLVRDEDFPDMIVIRPRQQQQLVKRDERPLAEPPLQGQPAGGFRPIAPEERAAVQPDGPPPPLIPDQPEKDPAAECVRQMTLGKLAFASREYARSERRFQQAAKVAPREAVPHFYLAQARIALGKYREASAAIHDGLRLFPRWPAAPFRVADLYEGNAADFERHRQQLAAALHSHPQDPVLLFLSGYQLWFDGRQDEARTLFRRAARMVKSPFFIDLFLLDQPAAPLAGV